jgi:hypothetical protein
MTAIVYHSICYLLYAIHEVTCLERGKVSIFWSSSADLQITQQSSTVIFAYNKKNTDFLLFIYSFFQGISHDK